MFVGAGEEKHVLAIQSLKARQRIGRDRLIGVTDVRYPVRICDRSGDEIGAAFGGVGFGEAAAVEVILFGALFFGGNAFRFRRGCHGLRRSAALLRGCFLTDFLAGFLRGFQASFLGVFLTAFFTVFLALFLAFLVARLLLRALFGRPRPQGTRLLCPARFSTFFSWKFS